VHTFSHLSKKKNLNHHKFILVSLTYDKNIYLK